MFKRTILSIFAISFYSTLYAAGMGMDFSNSNSGEMGNSSTGGMMTSQTYNNFSVDLSNDAFINPATFNTISGGMNFTDDNNDGVVDIVQNTDWFQSMGFGNWMDQNQDGIGDMFQTMNMYQLLGMDNYVDIDGDGLCDNYESMPMVQGSSGMMDFFGNGMMQNYEAFDVDLNNDVFTNTATFDAVSGGMNFTDDNNDGVVDIVQNTALFQSMGFGSWMDQNQDGIGDMFQTMDMYQLLGMDNYVDINGDGLCDNYATQN